MLKFILNLFGKKKKYDDDIVNFSTKEIFERLKEKNSQLIHVYRQFKDELSSTGKTWETGWYLLHNISYYNDGKILGTSWTPIPFKIGIYMKKNDMIKLDQQTNTQKKYSINYNSL